MLVVGLVRRCGRRTPSRCRSGRRSSGSSRAGSRTPRRPGSPRARRRGEEVRLGSGEPCGCVEREDDGVADAAGGRRWHRYDLDVDAAGRTTSAAVPVRPARTASASLRIATAVSAGVSAPRSRPGGAVDSGELAPPSGPRRRAPPGASPASCASRSRRRRTPRCGAQLQRRHVELQVVREHDDRRAVVGRDPASATSGHSTISSSALGIRSGVAKSARGVDADRVPAEQLRRGAERLRRVDRADDDEPRRRPVDLGEDLQRPRARASRCA